MRNRLPAVGLATVALAVIAIGGAAGAFLWWQRGQGGTHRASIDASTVVLLGDSLTELGDWASLLPGHPVSNHGYSGYTTEELIPVAESVAAEQPRMVLIMTGTNDIRDARPPAWTESHLLAILDHFDRSAPDTTIVIQTVLPRADAVGQVAAVNERLMAVATERGLTVLDLHPHFDDGDGGLRAEETTDGIHISELGYQRWAGVLDAFLAEQPAAG